YVFAEILFLEVVYANVTTIAGYSRDEMLIFVLIGQMWAYIYLGVIMQNFTELISQINTGQLDLILTKPLPHLFYVNYQKINIYKTIRDGTPPLLLLILIIEWSNLSIELIHIFPTVLIFICGVICSNT